MKKSVEKEIFAQAINAFKKRTGFQIILDDPSDYFSGWIISKKMELPLKIKVHSRVLRKETLGIIVKEMQQIGPAGLLIADYINPNIAQELKKLGIWFLDTSGNAYINAPPFYIEIQGLKRNTNQQKKTMGSAFNKKGIQVLFVLILDPNLVKASYRTIAEAAGVALGTVSAVIQDLKKLGFIVDMGKRGRHLKVSKKLIDRWVVGYVEKLRPSLSIGYYSPVNGQVDTRMNLVQLNAYWGGEVAAEKITQYLNPVNTTVYVRGHYRKLQFVLRLQKDPAGKVELIESFWPKQYDFAELPGVVHPLIVYADLLATVDPRNLEVAKIIYERSIIRLIQ